MWEIDTLQELGKPLLGEENAVGSVLSVYPVFGRDEEFDDGSFRSLSKSLLLFDGGCTNGAGRYVDTLETADKGGFVCIVDLSGLEPLGEPPRVGGLYGFLFENK